MSQTTSVVPNTLLTSSTIPRTIVFLELGLGLDRRKHEFLHLFGGLVDVVAHTLGAQLLGYNVELQAVLVDHVGDTPALVNDLAPAVAVEVLGG